MGIARKPSDPSARTNRYADWLTAIALGIAAAMPVWGALTEYGWLGIFFGEPLLFWGAVLVWAACVLSVIVWRQRWWVLITAPIVLYPFVPTYFFLRECGRGNCL